MKGGTSNDQHNHITNRYKPTVINEHKEEESDEIQNLCPVGLAGHAPWTGCVR
jgi:hypothetical protein